METLPINVTDLAILAILGLSAAFAFFRGFVHELLAIGSWVGAGGVTLLGFPYAQPLAHDYIRSKLIADMVAGIVLFVIVLIVLSIVTRILSRRVPDSSLGPLDRSLGLVFGALRGAVLVSIAWLMLLWVIPRDDHPDWISQARALPLIEQGGVLLSRIMPERLGGFAEQEASGKIPGQMAAEGLQELLRPSTKGGLIENKPGYKGAERDAMQRLIEATTQQDSTAEENRQ